MPSLWRLEETPQGTYYREESQQKHFSRKARWPRTESDLHCRAESEHRVRNHEATNRVAETNYNPPFLLPFVTLFFLS